MAPPNHVAVRLATPRDWDACAEPLPMLRAAVGAGVGRLDLVAAQAACVRVSMREVHPAYALIARMALQAAERWSAGSAEDLSARLAQAASAALAAAEGRPGRSAAVTRAAGLLAVAALRNRPALATLPLEALLAGASAGDREAYAGAVRTTIHWDHLSQARRGAADTTPPTPLHVGGAPSSLFGASEFACPVCAVILRVDVWPGREIGCACGEVVRLDAGPDGRAVAVPA